MRTLWILACVGAGVLAATQPAAVHAAPPDPAVARGVPRGVAPPASAASAVGAAQQTTVPGDLRPEKPVTPQLRVPLGKVASQPDATPGNAPGGIDDRAARCMAMENPAERAACRARAAPPSAASGPRR